MVFFANCLLLAVYFSYVKQIMLNKKKIWVIFLFKFKMGHKAAEVTQNINSVFDPRLLMNIHCSAGLGSFAKKTRDVKSTVARHWKLTMTNWEPLSKLTLLTAIQEVAQEFNVNHSMVIQHLKQIGKVKKLNKWVPCELITNQKKIINLKCHLLLQQQTISLLDWIVTCDEKWILYDNWWWPTQWEGQEDTPKHFPKLNLYQKISWSLFGGLLPVWPTIAFWILAKPVHLRSTLSKSMRYTKNCNACSQHWSTERAQFSTAMSDTT